MKGFFARVLALVVMIVTIAAALAISDKPSVSAGPEIRPASRSDEEERVIQIYRSTNEAVVFITTITLTVDPFDMFMEVKP